MPLIDRYGEQLNSNPRSVSLRGLLSRIFISWAEDVSLRICLHSSRCSKLVGLKESCYFMPKKWCLYSELHIPFLILLLLICNYAFIEILLGAAKSRVSWLTDKETMGSGVLTNRHFCISLCPGHSGVPLLQLFLSQRQGHTQARAGPQSTRSPVPVCWCPVGRSLVLLQWLHPAPMHKSAPTNMHTESLTQEER